MARIYKRVLTVGQEIGEEGQKQVVLAVLPRERKGLHPKSELLPQKVTVKCACGTVRTLSIRSLYNKDKQPRSCIQCSQRRRHGSKYKTPGVKRLDLPKVQPNNFLRLMDEARWRIS